jgi:DNA-binding PadR family transcriptional regulator
MRFIPGELHLCILALLSSRPMHGYELMGELQNRLGPRYKASPGSIYPALSALETEGLIEATEEGERRVYELTADGAQAYVRRAQRVAAMEARLGIKIANGLDVVLARLARRVWAVAPKVEETQIEHVLEDAAARIESMAEGR